MPIKKPQLRRCGYCHSPGHNKATCQNFKADPPKTSTSQPLKFFVHHVNTPAPSSPHIINLKQDQKDLWNNSESSAPDSSKELLFHNYHSQKTSVDETHRISPALFSDLHGVKKTTGVTTPKLEIKPFREKKPGRKKITAQDIKSFAAKLAPSKLAMATVLILTLALSIPGPLTGYFESLAETKDLITSNSTAGFMALQESASALKSANFENAEIATASALSKFNVALGALTTKHTILKTIAKSVPYVSGQIESREKVLLSGEQIAIGNSYLLAGLKEIEKNNSLPVTDKLNLLVKSLRLAYPNYEEAVKNLNEVNPNSLPPEYRQQFSEFKNLFSGLVKDFKRIAGLNEIFQEIFGGKGLRRYLLVFQNPAELRPTGGFLGSFAIIDVKDGKIVNLDIPAGGSYDLQGQLTEYVIPPLPLTINNKRWEFQDANWFPDFPASAEKMLWFYNKSRNVTADGVIAINASVLERILGVVGPVTDEARNITLSSSTALTSIQKIVETGPEKLQNKPKQILADIAPKLLTSIQNSQSGNLLPLLGTLKEALEEKEIQAYFTDSAAEEQLAASGWTGSLLNPGNDSDYLFVVNTNLQGQKSDARIKQIISHQAVVDTDGTVVDTVTITREHTGNAAEQFYGSTNVDYLRIYVPEGSALLSASGFSWPDEKNFRAPEHFYVIDSDLAAYERETGIDQNTGTRITSEFGKTAFGNWVVTEPGQTSRVEFSYRLPFKISTNTSTPESVWEKILSSMEEKNLHYQLVVQKQSGINSEFESQIIFSNPWQPTWTSGQNLNLANNGINILKTTLSRDSIWAVIMKSPNK